MKRTPLQRGFRASLAWLALAVTAPAQEPPAPEPEDPAPASEEAREDPPQQDDPRPAPEPDPVGEQEGPPPLPEPPPPTETPSQQAGTETPAVLENAPPVGEPPVVPARPPIAWPLAYDGIALHMRAIAEAHPELAALEIIGRSVGGRDILALRLAARDGAASTENPVLLLADYQGSGSAGPEVALDLAWQMCEDYARDEGVRVLLAHTSLVIAPALDPDARAEAASAAPRPAVRFDLNFPSGWQPETVRPGSGRVSLSQPETLATARFLANLKGCAVVLGFAAPLPRGAPYPGAELPQADREVFARLGAALELEGAGALIPWFELGSGGGGLFDFAYQARGIYPLVFPLPGEEEVAAAGLAGFRAEVAARVLRCLTLLPRLEVAQEGLERLASDTWQLDVRIQNVGMVPTSSALARHRDPPADVALRLDGAKLVATAKKPVGDAAYTDASFQVRTPLSGGILLGGEGRWLRLILEASSGAEVRVTAVSLWAGSDAIQVTLP